MSQLAVVVGGLWSACSITLSNYVVTNRQAEEQVQQRSNRKKESNTVTDQMAIAEDENATSVTTEAGPAPTVLSYTGEIKPVTDDSHTIGAEQNATTAKIKEE